MNIIGRVAVLAVLIQFCFSWVSH